MVAVMYLQVLYSFSNNWSAVIWVNLMGGACKSRVRGSDAYLSSFLFVSDKVDDEPQISVPAVT
eukprot:6795455-Ditylum_brightwellii.AAC.1